MYYRACQVFKLKILSSTGRDYTAMYLTWGPLHWNNRIVEELEENADYNLSDCK